MARGSEPVSNRARRSPQRSAPTTTRAPFQFRWSQTGSGRKRRAPDSSANSPQARERGRPPQHRSRCARGPSRCSPTWCRRRPARSGRCGATNPSRFPRILITLSPVNRIPASNPNRRSRCCRENPRSWLAASRLRRRAAVLRHSAHCGCAQAAAQDREPNGAVARLVGEPDSMRRKSVSHRPALEFAVVVLQQSTRRRSEPHTASAHRTDDVDRFRDRKVERLAIGGVAVRSKIPPRSRLIRLSPGPLAQRPPVSSSAMLVAETHGSASPLPTVTNAVGLSRSIVPSVVLSHIPPPSSGAIADTLMSESPSSRPNCSNVPFISRSNPRPVVANQIAPDWSTLTSTRRSASPHPMEVREQATCLTNRLNPVAGEVTQSVPRRSCRKGRTGPGKSATSVARSPTTCHRPCDCRPIQSPWPVSRATRLIRSRGSPLGHGSRSARLDFSTRSSRPLPVSQRRPRPSSTTTSPRRAQGSGSAKSVRPSTSSTRRRVD